MSRPAAPLGLLRDATVRRLWLASSLVNLLRWLDILGYGLFAVAVSGEPLVVTGMMLARMLPLFVLGVLAGTLADRIDRRRGLALCLGGMVTVDLVLAALALTGRFGVVTGLLGALAGGLFWVLELPLRRSLLAEAAGLERVGTSMGLELLTNNAMRMLGPAVGGAVVAGLGISGVLLAGAVGHATALALILRNPAAPPSTAAAEPVLVKLREGVRFLGRSRMLQGTLALTMIVNLFGFPYVALGPVIGHEVMDLGPTGIGLLMACEGLGALIGSVLILYLASEAWFRLIYVTGTALFEAGVLVFAFLPSPIAAGAALALAGVGMAMFNTMQTVLPILTAPPEMRGRALGLLTVAMGTAPFGFLMIGMLATWTDASTATALVSVAGVLAVPLSALVWPELRGRGPIRPAA